MRKSVSIVAARRELGRLAEEVQRTGQPVVLTRRGRPIAWITPQPRATRPRRQQDGFAGLRGTIEMTCSFQELQRAIRDLRGEFAANLERRVRMVSARRPAPRG